MLAGKLIILIGVTLGVWGYFVGWVVVAATTYFVALGGVLWHDGWIVGGVCTP